MNSLALSSSTTRTSNAPTLGFVGLGWIGRNRLSAAKSAGAVIAAIADISHENLLEVKETVPDAMAVSSLNELLLLDLDGIVIATPNALHARQTITALEYGLPVFCQKPLGRNITEVTQIIKAAKRNDRLLGVDLSYRYIDGLRNIRNLIRNGSLGEVFAVNFTFHNAYGPGQPWFYNPALAGGGCVMDLGTHLVDAALWCLNTSVKSVSSLLCSNGHHHKQNANSVEDYATIQLEFMNGAIADISCSWKLHAGYNAIIEFTFYGTRGGASLRNIDGSFTEFVAEQFDGTKRHVISESRETWQAGAIHDWIHQLSRTPTFDHRIKSQIELAKILDAIYESNASRNAITLL